MAHATCSIEGCSRPHYGLGWCNKHYQRWRKHGDPHAGGRPSFTVCTVDGCSSTERLKRGLCNKHYCRLRRYGDPEFVQEIHGDDVARFFSYVDKTGPGGCWLWTGLLYPHGYAQFRVNGANVGAHRWSYEHHVGPIPEGLTIDHVHARGCRHRHCVNPDHLEAVTAAENNRRRSEANQ